jgi:hypothetical protein
MELLVALGVAMLLLIACSVAAYVVLRWAFDRAADRAAEHLGRGLLVVTRRLAPPLSRLGVYAAVENLSEDVARRQFSESIERTARIMDSAISVPVIGPMGLDALLGLIPVAGDAVGAAVSVRLIARSLRYGVSHDIIARMLGNVLLDVILGVVPLVGDLADLWFRANARNVNLLRRYLEEEARRTPSASTSAVGFEA